MFLSKTIPFVVLLIGTAVQATSFVPRPLQDTTKATATIVRGKVGSSYADWGQNADGSKRLYTIYDLQVVETFKGEPKAGTLIQFRELGGEKDGVGMHIAGAAQFKSGEDVVLMLGEKNQDGSYNLIGLMSGKYQIGHDASGNETLIGAVGDELAQPGAEPHVYTLDDLRKIVADQQQTQSSPTPSETAIVTAMVSPSARASSPSPTRSFALQPAPALQIERDQGAVQSGRSESGITWPYWLVGILVIGAIWRLL